MSKVVYTSLVFLIAAVALAGLPTTLADFFIPGSQPGQSGNLETPNKCDNCHGGYDKNVEPAFIWRGSMMAQAARDPLYFATVAIANQDAAESGDLCIRCHSPAGWLEGRSSPTDGSALNNNDRQGVQCDFCHKLVMPSDPITNQFPDDIDYSNNTFPQDSIYLETLAQIPPQSGNGGYVADASNTKRGPLNDANATHQVFYSPFHSTSNICGTCHDVSNPAFAKDAEGNYVPNELNQPSPSFITYDMFPIERTYSEWKNSAYNTPDGVYAPQFGGNKDYVRTCQDCHMRDVTGHACNKSGVKLRDDLPLHDMTGGNTFTPNLIDLVYPGEADLDALDSGIVRARYMLQHAATLGLDAVVQGGNYLATITVTNETGHKLPSGYPEGRRIWLNVKAFNTNNSIIYESGAYVASTGELIEDSDIKIYEIKPGMTDDVAAALGYEPGPSFHFVTNNKIFYDNRIPPRGFTNANFEMIQSPPVGYSYPDGQYWDETQYLLPGSTAKIEVHLYYQTTSKEFVEFLRDENVTNDWGNIIYNLWNDNGKSAPEEMQAVSMDVTPITTNQPPVLDPIGSKSTTEDVTLNFTITASDDTGIPSLTVSNKPDGATFIDHGDGTATFDWTPTFLESGVYDVTFIATDNESATDEEIVTITVIDAGNQLPVLASIGARSTTENVNLSFDISATDIESIPALTAPDAPSGSSLTDHGDGTATFSWTPTYLESGDYDVTFTATDDSGAVDVEVVTITVIDAGNQLPVLASIGSKSTTENVNLNFDISATDAESIPSLTAPDAPTGSSLTDHGDGTATFSWTPTYLESGDYDVTFTATDDSGAVDIEVVTITVIDAGNQLPILASIGPKSTTENVELNFDISATDIESIPSLTAPDAPTGSSLTDHGDGTATFSWAPTNTQAGIYEVTFIATDDSSATDQEIVTITVIDSENQSPILNAIGNKIIDENEILSFSVTATDPDGPSPKLTTSALPDGATFGDNGDGSGDFNWIPSFDQAGSYEVTFYATDDQSAVDGELITITVNNINRPPVMDGLDDVSGQATYLIEVTVTALDPDNDVISFDSNNLPGGAYFIGQGWDDGLGRYKALFSWTPDVSQAGTYPDIEFICSDGFLSDHQIISITVSEGYICGDVNDDGAIDILDIVFIINFKYKAGPAPDPLVSGDVNSDGDINILDVVSLINYKYKAGAEPNCP